MSETLINSSYKLKKIHPIILKNDSYSLNIFNKESRTNNRNKKLSFKSSTNKKYNNLKALICPNLEKIDKIQKKISIKNDELKTQFNYQDENVYTINNINNNPKIKRNFFKDSIKTRNNFFNRSVKTPKNINNKNKNTKKVKYKINKSTNISIELNRIKHNNNFNNNNGDIDEDKIIFTENNELINFKFYKPKQFILDDRKYLFNEYSSSTKNKNININNRIKTKMNFITNIKLLNLKDSNEGKENILYSNILNKDNYKKLSFKKDKTMKSLNNNYVWNDYIQIQKNKKIEQLKKKRKKKEDMHNMIKLFKDSYSFKKIKNKINMNDKEKYLNYLDDHSLGLRENIIKNYLQDDKGGKQNIRQTYNPLNI